MSLLIRGLGTARPTHSVDQRDLAAVAAACCCATDRQRKLLPELYRRTTVGSRGCVVVNSDNGLSRRPVRERMLAFYPPAADDADRGPTLAHRLKRYPEEALPLARQACEAALADASLRPDQITQLVTVSCTGFSAPGIDIGLIDTLGLPATTERTMVGFMGCHGAMNGLRVARGVVAPDVSGGSSGGGGGSGGGGVVLMCCVELCTLHFQYGWDPEKVVANALFADGAAAVVGEVVPEDEASDAMRVFANGSCLLPDSRGDMTWLIRDHGFEMTLSPRVPGLIEQHLEPWFTPWLAESRPGRRKTSAAGRSTPAARG